MKVNVFYEFKVSNIYMEVCIYCIFIKIGKCIKYIWDLINFIFVFKRFF